MGLDNGIIVRAKTRKGSAFLQDNFEYCKLEDNPLNYEFNYMRKNWGIRNDIIHNYFCGDRRNKDNIDTFDGVYDIELDVNNLEDLIHLFSYYLDERHWRDEADSIWDWHIGIIEIAKTIRNLRELELSLENEEISAEDIRMYFYDSY